MPAHQDIRPAIYPWETLLQSLKVGAKQLTLNLGLTSRGVKASPQIFDSNIAFFVEWR